MHWRESNPGLPHGKREFYHWTTNARKARLVTLSISHVHENLIISPSSIRFIHYHGHRHGLKKRRLSTHSRVNYLLEFACALFFKDFLLRLLYKHLKLHWQGIEPRSPAWKAGILPLNHQCICTMFSQAMTEINAFRFTRWSRTQ